MKTAFTNEEKRKFFFRKYLKEHIFDFILTIVVNIIFVLIILYFCKGTDYLLGIVLSVVYSLGRIAYDIRSYKKDYLNIDFKK